MADLVQLFKMILINKDFWYRNIAAILVIQINTLKTTQAILF